MSAPTQEFLRRGQVMDWLEEEGIPRGTTRRLIEDKVIKGDILCLRKRRAEKTGKRKPETGEKGKKKNGKKGNGARATDWMRFRRSQIKEALNI